MVQLTQLTVALEEQRIDFARQYKALQAEFTAQTESLKPKLLHQSASSYPTCM
jgi:hypothetical protein